MLHRAFALKDGKESEWCITAKHIKDIITEHILYMSTRKDRHELEGSSIDKLDYQNSA